MGNCNTCSCNDKGEIQTYEIEVDNKQNRKQSVKSSSNNGKSNQSDLSNGQQTVNKEVFLKKNLLLIIKIQSTWRGYLVRKQVAFIKQTNKRSDSKYFTIDESKETISKVLKYNPRAQREERTIYKFKTGATYTGQWIGGFRDGFGIQEWPDGQWKDNRAHGQGKFIHVDGDVYEGNWINDKANGFGLYIHVNGARYEGNWQDDLQHGPGKETWTDGSVYEGQYYQGKKHGYGIYSWSDESRYEGEWYENKIRGLGTYTWLDGRMYQGEWIDNNMEGMGIYTWSDGRRYEGEYRDDKKHGFGIYTWADEREYQGMWFKGKQHGLGRYKVPSNNENKYGLWEDGKRIEWFDENQAMLIIKNQLDFTQKFHKQESKQYIDMKQKFTQPPGFLQRLAEIKKQFKISTQY
ncbi:UNKNOWN [Stylonychia lemnae]|uniref:Morn repeat protein n=1 Tax=Stylonychia lemnae TaxID=5949 RepID=A0A078AKG3_STYLE|nr:UNKNOWN [Stylonychia lemnae]|eukprot:CDW81907.1 UNKNOWN [Stylonychia lemnae]